MLSDLLAKAKGGLVARSPSKGQSSSSMVGGAEDDGLPPTRDGFHYEKNVCALSYWEPIELLTDASISDIHLVVRRPRFKPVKYKEKRDVMKLAKKNSGQKRRLDEQQVYCLKSIMKDHVGDDRVLDEMRREIYTMSRLDHPNIVTLIEAYERRRHIYLVMEYCPGGNLTDRKFSEAECAQIVRKVLSTVAYLHEHGVVHRDIKLENIVFAANGEPKLIDFGLATKFLSTEYKNMKDKVGTLYSMAPQVLQGVYDYKCDLWWIGVVTYILLCNFWPFWGPIRKMPWSERSEIMIDRIMRCEYMRMEGPKWAVISSAAKEFVASLLQLDPDDRPTALEALESPWIQRFGYGEEKLLVAEQDDQPRLRIEFRNKSRDLLSSLPERAIVSLREDVFKQDTTGNCRIRVDEFRQILEQDGRGLSADAVRGLFEYDRLDASWSFEYIDFFAEAFQYRGRLVTNKIAQALDNLDVDGTRKISKDNLRPVLQEQSPDVRVAQLCEDIETDSDGCVSTIQVLELVGRKMATSLRDSIRGSGSNNADLVNETNAVIPGGNIDASTQPKFTYDARRKSLHRI